MTTNNTNTNLTFKGNPIKVEGASLKVGDKLPSFSLTANDMSSKTEKDFSGKVLIISLVPSLDTPVCSIETAKFNNEASEFKDQAAVITISADLPFAQARWCGAQGATNVVTLSSYKDTKKLGLSFGTYITDMAFLSRAVFVADKSLTIQYVEYVKELAEEPNYNLITAKVRELL